MSRNTKAKNFGPPTSGQKTITQFFTKQPTNSSNAGTSSQNVPSSSSSSRQNSNNRTLAGNKRKNNVVTLPNKTGRKTLSSSSAVASTSKGPVEIVDLIDSDDERSKNNTVQAPAWVMGPQKYTGIKTEIMNNTTTTTNDDDDYEIPDPFLLQTDNQDDNNDTSMNCKIRIVDFTNILETCSSQSSETEDETQELQLNCSGGSSNSSGSKNNNNNTNNNKKNNYDDLTQVINNGNQVQFSPSTPTKKSVWEVISPTKSTTTTGPTKPQRNAPLKNPKTKVTAFSPIKQLNRSRSRSASKTPTKNRPHRSSSPRSLSNQKQQQPNGKNQIPIKSPLRALWSNARPPYYLNNFLTVLNTVVEDSHNSHLLNEDDLDIITKFRNLSNNAQCLFVRLTNRKFKWEKVSAVKYPAISENLLPLFKELHANKFLVDLNDEKLSLDKLLDILSQPSIDELCNKLHITVPGKGKTKEKCKTALLKSAEKQKTLQGNMSDIIYKAAVKEVGPTYKIASAPKNLFSRIFILFSPPQYWDNDADNGSNQQLFFLLTEAGKMEFPDYKIIKSIRIYETREDILEFQEAWTLHSDIQAYAESKQWEECVEVAEEAMTKLDSLLQKPERKETDLKLPLFLRAYTAGSLLVRICWLGIDGLQKVRDYKKANEHLSFLLKQDTYLPHYRGQFYERLVINSRHLRVPQADVRKIIHQALSDEHTRDSHKLDLTGRLEKLKPDKPKAKPKPKKKKPKKRKPKKKKRVTRSTTNCENSDSDFEVCSDEEESSSSSTEFDESADNDSEIECVEIFNVEGFQAFQIKNNLPEIVIEGEKLPMFDREHGKSRFLGDIHGTTPMSTVEGFALQYYQNKGYNHGAHAEGSVISTIYGLLFWHLIYHEEIPDVFHSPYQAFPLDLFFDDFRKQRSTKIENLLLRLRFEYTMQDALDIMQVNWTENLNRVSIVSWDLFPRFEDLQVLVESMGLPLIAGICDRLSQNYRYYRSGFPDITLWDGKRCKFAEVKGPGDTLSAKQRLWLDYLISLNAAAEVCRVKSVSNKRIRINP